jgi:hypothetical protein
LLADVDGHEELPLRLRKRCPTRRLATATLLRAFALTPALGALAAVFAFGSAVSAFVSAVAAVFFDRPRPPRLPRRRLGLVLLDCPASSAGSVLTGSGASGAAASLGAFSSDFLDRNQRKKNLLRARALRQRRSERRRGACAAGCR